MRRGGGTARQAKRRYLLVPAAGAGEGLGHLKRCLRLARDLAGEAGFLTAAMDAPAREYLGQELARWAGRSRPTLVVDPRGTTWDMVVVDRRRTSAREARGLARLGPCVHVDEGGEARDGAAYLVDTLPGPPRRSLPNVFSPALLDLPARRRVRVGSPRRVLVAFGGEDRGNLAGRLLEALAAARVFPGAQVTVAEGALFGARDWPRGVRVRPPGGGLGSELWKYDLVFCHFGLTAFEALASGVPVILLHPTRYHALLGRAARLPDIGLRTPRMRKLRRLLRDGEVLNACVEGFCRQIEDRRGDTLAGHLAGLEPAVRASCPVCGSREGKVIARFPDRTYRACAGCGVSFLQDFARRGARYGREYFFSEYRAQYGRTYLEDFAAIQALCAPRVRQLRRLLGRAPGGAVVDVGCAYGPFLSALAEAGLEGFGVDVSADAVAHVRRKLAFPAAQGAFESMPRSALPRRVSAITMWYVIEHFREPGAVLARAAQILPMGGVLAFATPNGRGVSALSNRTRFLERSPADHLSVFSPRGLRSILARHGFRLVRVRVTGHHPERFPGILGRAAGAGKAGARIVRSISRLFGLGDTFEAYAVKAHPAQNRKRGRP